MVITRYAPSPTGPLHIGGARTALFNWAFARHHRGRFLLRFEDTDRARSTPESEVEILEAMAWLGLDHDPVPGGPEIPRQTERMARYSELVQPLLESGAAYRCTCTPVELEAMRARARADGSSRVGYDGTCRDREIGADSDLPFCVRLRVRPDGPTRWEDCIAGASGQEPDEIEDFVLVRSDGTPIYHMAVVADDHDMDVTHVIRGREHITSTPRQLLIYDALGFDPPQFAHVPLLVSPNGKKLSKREAAVSVQAYQERGFTPESVFNYLTRLGWGHGDVEVVSHSELVELFTLDGVGQSPSQVHEDKLLWLSQHYLQNLPTAALHGYVSPFLEAEAGGSVEIDEALALLLDLLRPRAKTLVDMAERARFVLHDEVELDAKAARKHLKPEARPALVALREALAATGEWSAGTLEPVLESVCETHELKMGQLAQPARVAVTGSSASPPIFETLQVTGRTRTLARLDGALAYIDAHT